ncbi:MAG: hypothetical protein ACUVS2_11885 [Candidatus Flexifilum sp.]
MRPTDLRPARALALILLTLLSLSLLPAAAQETGLDTTITANASLRTGPGTEWNRAALVSAGTPIRLDGRAPGGGWARGILPNGTVGWVVYTALAADPAQIDALRSIWVEEPFTLPPPEGPAPTPPPPAGDPSAPPTGQTVGGSAGAAEALPAPAINSAPVSGFNLGGHVAGLDAAAVAAMRRAGMTWVKKQVRYQMGQDPGSVAGLINQAHANGFRILLGIVGLPGQVLQSGYFDAYASFVGGVAALGADAIEVWNEPNIDREWPAGSIDPALYTRLLAQAYNAIKSANRNTLVISGAPAPTGFFGGCSGVGCDDNLFVAGMYAAGAASYMDCVGIHYNEGILPPTATSGDPRGNSGHYSRYFLSMIDTYNAAMRGSRPLCFTEFGYLSPQGYGPLPGAFGWAENVTVAQQAQWLDQAVSMAARRNVRLLIIWNVNFTEYGEDPMAGYAIIRPDGSCPACDLLGS